MRILVDVGHPAHVHYFKHFMWEMTRRGHACLVTARDRGEIFALLDSYGFDYVSRGRGGMTLAGRMLYLLRGDWAVLKAARRFNPDIFVSFGSMYAAQVSTLMRKPHLAFDDTEFSRLEYRLYAPFSDVVFTPYCFRRNLGEKQLRFDGFMELCYLHPNRFSPQPAVLEELGVKEGERYAIMRFVAFKAIHDAGVRGLSPESKLRAVAALEEHGKVFVSAEGPLPPELEKNRLPIHPSKLHDAIAFASVYLGDSQTTSTEAALLGVPAIRCNKFAESPEERANFLELEKRFHLLINYGARRQEEAIERAVELISDPDARLNWQMKREQLLQRVSDVTSFMVWVVEGFPGSVDQLRAGDPSVPDFR